MYVQLEFLEEYPLSLAYGLFDTGHTSKGSLQWEIVWHTNSFVSTFTESQNL